MSKKLRDSTVFNKKKYTRIQKIYFSKKEAQGKAEKLRNAGDYVVVDKRKEGYFLWTRRGTRKEKEMPAKEYMKKKKIGKITNREFLLGDFDNDKIKNVDDKYPFRKSGKTVEETKLSTSIKNVYKTQYEKQKLSRLVVKNYRAQIRKKKRGASQKSLENMTPWRVKQPISTLNKAVFSGIEDIKDYIGVSYIGNNYKDLRDMKYHLLNHYQLKESRDYYRDKRQDGYKAIHLNVKDPKTKEIIEIQLKTKRIKKVSDINHLLYKEGKQNIGEFKKLVNIAERADNGDNQSQKYFDNLTKKQIKDVLSKNKKR
jgi:ppGpp synthetase/RelA/SpoT-type nucleotidyltranferase